MPSPTEEPSLLYDVSVEFHLIATVPCFQQPWHLLSSRSPTPPSIRQPCHLWSPALFFKSLSIASIKTEYTLLCFPFCSPSFVDSVADALHSAVDLFYNHSPLFDGSITSAEGYAPKSAGSSDFLLPPSTQINLLHPPLTQIIGRGGLLLPPSTDLRSLCSLVRLHDSTASGRAWQPPEPNELQRTVLLLLLQRCLEEPQSFRIPASKRQ
ncbi:hypothetical protein B296_00013805 [Ensete ventricosum]|uniref:Uncharacterized protein n=1 Tax=Ensete ventricosum TaxID=4639 RepID=A0A426YF25_ENSVE|nr:hypothetical protein B296_00013805 [Ensete ventricosum]